MKKAGFYIIKEKFFIDMNDPYLVGNKMENRPHYFCLSDETREGIYWMIPLTSRVNKYKQILHYRKKANKSCDIIHNDDFFFCLDGFL